MINKGAIVSTSANPFHYGHLDIYNKAKEIFPDVKVIIAQNSDKEISNNLQFHLNAYRIPYEIITDMTIADYCKEHDIRHIIRGIRNGVDAEYELKLDFTNKEIWCHANTIFMPTSDTYSNISSSTIRELLKYKKYDIVKKYMNEIAMWRYVYGIKYNVFFGKSCVGKTTYLNSRNIPTIDVDKYLWEVVEEIYGKEETKRFREISRKIIYAKESPVWEKDQKLSIYSKEIFTEDFWDIFFKNLETTDKYRFLFCFDWASVRFYIPYIPMKYYVRMNFIELTCSNESREEKIIAKGFQDKIKHLDEMYDFTCYRGITDQTIDVSSVKDPKISLPESILQ